MKNILVSGASGIIGYGILRSLQLSGRDFKLIGTTIYADSPAEGFCDIFEQAIPTNDPNYISWLLKVIEKHQINLIIPGIEADMYAWAENQETLAKSGVKIVMNNKELIDCCHDKWTFYQKLEAAKSPYAIPTTLTSNFKDIVTQFNLPIILKPRCGHGSKGIVKVMSEELFNNHQQFIGEQLMVQPIIGNDEEEYTTSAFCDGKGGFFAYMTLKRRLSKDGFTEKAEVVELDNIEEALHSLCEVFKPIGPTNFQFRKDTAGLKLLEINPRISSSTSIRAKFGYNESLMAVDYFLEGKIIEQPLIKKGKAIRYIEDLIIYE
jgi:carbamoyl-phosphate synthase large subunit